MTSDLKTSFQAYRQRIDARLDAVVPKALTGQLALGDAMRDSILASGKRLRPLMTVLVAEDLGGSASAGVDAGCAVEMVHAASLVLDDLPCMDNATLRRGLPAIHLGHGEDLAVLVAIGALAGSYQLIAAIPGLSAEARIEVVAVLSRAVGVRGLVAGQFEDLRGGRRDRPVAEIAMTNGLKTGSLFSAAVEIGGVVAGAGAPVRAELRFFADELGHAFQLLDDLLDRSPDALELGKNVGQDTDKSTIVSMMGPSAVRRRIERHVAAAHASLDRVFGPGSRMHALVDLAMEAATVPGAAVAEPDAARRPPVDGFGRGEVQGVGAV